MRIFSIILLCLVASVCFGQTDSTRKSPQVDSMDVKIISIKELQGYLERINVVAMENLSIKQQAAYNKIFNELNTILAEADKKRKLKK